MTVRNPGSPLKSLRQKIALEYLTAPIHVILAAAFTRAFLGFRSKVLFDQVRRREHAFGMLAGADIAKRHGYKAITVVEFGVASGGGVMNMFDIGRLVEKETGVQCRIAGFDTGKGLPAPVDYRDHPEIFATGDFPLVDPRVLEKKTNGKVELILGDVKDTVPEFVERLDETAPLGFFTVDVDYYSSAAACLQVLLGSSEKYLPYFWSYFDDITMDSANPWCGELLAIDEFNSRHAHRKISKSAVLKSRRVFKSSDWIDMMRTVHVLDHPARQPKPPDSHLANTTPNVALGIGVRNRD